MRAVQSFLFHPEASYLGIDYGNKVCGLASLRNGNSDAFQPVPNGGNLTQLSLDILHESARAKPAAYIVGWPLDWDGGCTNLQAKRCLNFARVFAGVVQKMQGAQIPTLLYDERYTTDLGNVDFKQKRGALDGNSAYHIVQRWVLDEGAGSTLVGPVLNPAPDLEIFDPEEEDWKTPRSMAGFRRPPDMFVGKRKVMQAVQPASGGG